MRNDNPCDRAGCGSIVRFVLDRPSDTIHPTVASRRRAPSFVALVRGGAVHSGVKVTDTWVK